MFPTRTSLVAAGLVLALTLLFYQAATTSLTDTATAGATDQVKRAAGLFLTQNRLQALEFINDTKQYARQDALAKIFTLPDETARHTAAYQAANDLNEQIARAREHRPALVAIVDQAGKVVARDLNPNDLYGDDLKTSHPAVAAALSGTANKDIWAFRNRMYRVSCAPIVGADGKIAGALVVGFEESASDVRSLRDAIGTDVVVFLDGKIYASSFAHSGKDSLEEQDLAKVLFAGPQYAEPAVRERKQTAVFRAPVQGETFLAVAAPIASNFSQQAAGFVVLTSLDQALLPARNAGHFLLALGLLATLITMVASVYTSRRFLHTIDRIEAGVTEIINGNHDHVFEKEGGLDFEGLENALNVMVARLLGRPEPTEGGEAMGPGMDLSSGVASGTAPSSRSVPSGLAAPSAPAKLSIENQKLADEPEDQYQRRLYDEYVHAREQTGEGTRDLTFATFIEKLKDNEVVLCKKYGSRAVRFKVTIKNGQVTLKPVPLP